MVTKKNIKTRMRTRSLEFIWVCDCSGSMSQDNKIESLNSAIRESIPHMRDIAEDNPFANVYIRALKFADGASWHLPERTLVSEFEWKDLDVKEDDLTEFGAALRMLSEQLDESRMPMRGLTPVLVLVTDGAPTDDWKLALKELLNQRWAKKAIRIGIAIGKEANLRPIKRFIDNDEIPPLVAKNVPELVHYIKWASTAVVDHVSSPASQAATTTTKGSVPPPIAIPECQSELPDDW